MSTILISVVLTELIVPVTLRFPFTSKLPAIVTLSGRPIVTVEPSPDVGDTVISFAVP